MRFRKYARKHAFNILYQWDITGEPLEKIGEGYWEHLAQVYQSVINLAQDVLDKLEKAEDIDYEVYSKKFETFADEEILPDKLRKELYTVYSLLKLLEEFRNYYLSVVDFLSEPSKKRREKAKKTLEEIKEHLKTLQNLNKENSELFEEVINFVGNLNIAQSIDEAKEQEKEFKKLILRIVKPFLEDIKQFSQKRLDSDLGQIKEYANNLIKTYEEHKVDIDSLIEEYLKDWTIDSIGSIERNLLRLGTAEFVYVGVQDPGRAFNDYIDMAKNYVGKKAAKFVNGVLSAIFKNHGKKIPAESA
jgi:N utilization substance protein B